MPVLESSGWGGWTMGVLCWDNRLFRLSNRVLWLGNGLLRLGSRVWRIRLKDRLGIWQTDLIIVCPWLLNYVNITCCRIVLVFKVIIYSLMKVLLR